MSDLKTKPTNHNVEAFLSNIDNEKRREDSFKILEIMRDISGEDAVLWGDSIVGFGSYHYKYASGREGDWMLTGFSPRKQNLTIYIMSGFDEYQELMERLGKYKTGKSCLYIKKLEDIDVKILKELIKKSIAHMKESNSQ